MKSSLRILLCLAVWPVGVPYLLYTRGRPRAAAGFVFVLGVLTIVGLSAVPWRSDDESRIPAAREHDARAPRAEYKILTDRKTDRVKRSVEVRLSEKVTAAVLQAIAYEIRDLDPTRYERTFILYYLPDMSTERPAWATSSFKPDLEIAIRGTTLEQDQQVSSSPMAATGGAEALGCWMDDSIRARYTLSCSEEGTRLDVVYDDGSSATYHLQAPGMGIFQPSGSNPDGVYYRIDDRGRLGQFDESGKIRTMGACPP